MYVLHKNWEHKNRGTQHILCWVRFVYPTCTSHNSMWQPIIKLAYSTMSNPLFIWQQLSTVILSLPWNASRLRFPLSWQVNHCRSKLQHPSSGTNISSYLLSSFWSDVFSHFHFLKLKQRELMNWCEIQMRQVSSKARKEITICDRLMMPMFIMSLTFQILSFCEIRSIFSWITKIQIFIIKPNTFII